MYQLVVFIPLEFKEEVKSAMFEAGAGRLGNYDSCCFEHSGLGQFRALNGSNPFIGSLNKLEVVEEIKVEMICEENVLSKVIAAMKEAHPYETPAYYAIEVVGF